LALKTLKKTKAKVAVIMGSSSDLPALKGAIDVLKEFRVSTEVEVVSAHRSPEFMQDYAKAAHARGLQIIIAAAGGAAHLPGMVASLTTLPVIGVPVTVGKLDGLDALLSIVQMPKGIPVACVGVENSANAGLLAVRMLALQDEKLSQKLFKYENSLRKKVSQMRRDIQKKK
jgi:5-(carboxyamino)imidazole ribonucleotide mutase